MIARGRVRNLFLLLVAAMALSAVAVSASSAVAQNDASAAAKKKAKKKKAKKCKKGYVKKTTTKTVKKKGKKVKKKTTRCVKKKAKKKTSSTVKSVTLNDVEFGMRAKYTMTISLKKPATTVPVKLFAKRGRGDIDLVTSFTPVGEDLNQVAVLWMNLRPLIMSRALRNQPYSYWVEVDGVKSNVVK